MTGRRVAPTTVPTMPEYLSPDWFAEADVLLRSDPELCRRSRGVRLVLEQRIVNGSDALTWHVRFADGTVSMHEGRAPDADVVFVSDRSTAEGIRSGDLSAHAAFIAGDLRVEGSIAALLEHGELFASLDDVLGPLR